MAEIISLNQVKERRSENRKSIDRFYCVEIDLGRPLPIYQFKLRNISGHGACVLVKDGSSILKSLKIRSKAENELLVRRKFGYDQNLAGANKAYYKAAPWLNERAFSTGLFHNK